jgi:hypothetical protein
MSTANLDAHNLASVAFGGLVNEDVMQQIWNISKIPLPFTDIAGTDTHGNKYYEWTQDTLADPVTNNAVVDGADYTTNNTSTGARVGNHSQISVKRVNVSSRARESDTIGRADELSYQIMMRQQELKRDVEASCLANLASVSGTDSVAGVAGGLPSWLETNVELPAAGTPAAGGFDTSTGLTVAVTTGTAEALTESKIRDAAESCYENGGSPTILMMVPSVCRKLSEYLFTSSARIATLTSETGQSESGATAKGSVNVFVTDFGVVLELTPNRIQRNYTTDESMAFLIDPGHVRISYLYGYRVEPLAKTGLADNRLMSVDWTLVVTTEKAHGLISSIDNTAAVTA